MKRNWWLLKLKQFTVLPTIEDLNTADLSLIHFTRDNCFSEIYLLHLLPPYLQRQYQGSHVQQRQLNCNLLNLAKFNPLCIQNQQTYHVTEFNSYMRYICLVDIISIWTSFEVVFTNPMPLRKEIIVANYRK